MDNYGYGYQPRNNYSNYNNYSATQSSQQYDPRLDPRNYNEFGQYTYNAAMLQRKMDNLASSGYNQSPVTAQTQAQPGQTICRPVTGVEEARGAILDYPLNPYLFTDFANGRIYLKQITNDGTASLKTYVLEEPIITQSPEVPVSSQKTDFLEIERRLNYLENEWSKMNEQFITVNSNVASATESGGISRKSSKPGSNHIQSNGNDERKE